MISQQRMSVPAREEFVPERMLSEPSLLFVLLEDIGNPENNLITVEIRTETLSHFIISLDRAGQQKVREGFNKKNSKLSDIVQNKGGGSAQN